MTLCHLNKGAHLEFKFCLGGQLINSGFFKNQVLEDWSWLINTTLAEDTILRQVSCSGQFMSGLLH